MNGDGADVGGGGRTSPEGASLGERGDGARTAESEGVEYKGLDTPARGGTRVGIVPGVADTGVGGVILGAKPDSERGRTTTSAPDTVPGDRKDPGGLRGEGGLGGATVGVVSARSGASDAAWADSAFEGGVDCVRSMPNESRVRASDSWTRRSAVRSSSSSSRIP